MTITQDPGKPSTDEGTNNGGNGSGPSASSIASADETAAAAPSSAVATATEETPAPSSSAPPGIPTGGNGGDFKVQNGRDAQALNAKFEALTADSACTGNSRFSLVYSACSTFVSSWSKRLC